MSYELTGNCVSNTYQRLVQCVSGNYYDGSGNLLDLTNNASLGSTLINYVSNASLSNDFYWNNGYLEASLGSIAGLDAFATNVSVNLAFENYYTSIEIDSSFALKTDIESSLGLYVQKAGDTMTGNLIINGSLGINTDPTYTLDVSGIVRVSGYTGTGQSIIDAGLIVNNGEGVDSINDFTVKLRNYNAINTDSSENSIQIMSNASGKIGFFGTSPTTQSTGWTATNGTGDKVFDVSSMTLNQIADVLATLINELKNKGILGG